MKKRFLSILLSLCMVLALLPVTAFAEDNEEPTETPVCICEAVCAAEAMNADCPVCGAEGATIENCGKYEAPVEETEPEQTAIEKVQALIDALPDADSITEENRADVEAQLTAIDEAKLPLGDELDALDFTRYNDAIAALNELDGMGGAEVPETLEDTLQGSGTEAEPWILTQASFDDATDSSSPVSKTVIEGFLTDVLYTLQEGCYKLGEDKDIVLEYTGDGNAKIEIRGIVTLDLNGHTLTQTSGGVAAIDVYGTLTLNDSSDDLSGKISGGSIGVDLQTSGQFTMNGGTITGSTIGVNVGSGAMFTMNGGLITVVETGGSCVEVDNDGTFEMKGGKIEASANTFAIWNEGTLNAEVGTKLCLVKGLVGNQRGGIINGGVFKGPVNNPGGNSGRGTINGGVFYDTVTLEKSKTQINGGVFYGIVVNENKDDENPITGGVFFGGITGEGRIVGDQHNITIDLGDGTTRNGFVVGDTLYPLGEPPVTREGFIFNGWYKDAAFTEPWDFTNQNPVKDNMAFYAKWVCAVHSGGTATCKAKAKCETCGEEYGEVDSSNHVGGTEVRNAKDATCTEDGYTGDTYCLGCEVKLQEGKPITKLGHIDGDKNHVCDRENCKATLSTCSGGTATCKDKAVCEYCGKPYGEVDNSNHVGGTEVRNAKDATCTEDGYTGDTYCLGCDTKLEAGEPIAKIGHDYEGKVTKEATTTRTGTKTYTCQNCGHSYEEELAKLPSQRPSETESAKSSSQSASPKTGSPKTGDETPVGQLIAATTLSAVALAVLLLCNKKRKEN